MPYKGRRDGSQVTGSRAAALCRDHSYRLRCGCISDRRSAPVVKPGPLGQLSRPGAAVRVRSGPVVAGERSAVAHRNADLAASRFPVASSAGGIIPNPKPLRRSDTPADCHRGGDWHAQANSDHYSDSDSDVLARPIAARDAELQSDSAAGPDLDPERKCRQRSRRDPLYGHLASD